MGVNDRHGWGQFGPNGMIDRIDIDCCIIDIQALGFVVSEKVFVLHVWTPGAWLV